MKPIRIIRNFYSEGILFPDFARITGFVLSLFTFLPICGYAQAVEHTPEDVKVDTIAEFVKDGLHVVHLNYSYFGDQYIYTLSEQEQNLKENYDGKGKSAVLLWISEEEMDKDFQHLHQLLRTDVKRYGKLKFMNSKYRISAQVSYGTTGEIIKVSVNSIRPLYRHESHKRIARLIKQMSSHWLSGIQKGEPRLYHERTVFVFKQIRRNSYESH